MPDRPYDPIALQDELLELLYWIEGENIAGAATLHGLARFLTYDVSQVAELLQRLAQRGDVLAPAEPTGDYRLTEVGRREAARRFADEFAPMLSQGHGECNDPNCECHTNPAGAAECHARAGHKH